jgi:hypothetical protein
VTIEEDEDDGEAMISIPTNPNQREYWFFTSLRFYRVWGGVRPRKCQSDDVQRARRKTAPFSTFGLHGKHGVVSLGVPFFFGKMLR